MLLSNGKPLSSGRVTFVSADGLLPEVSGEIQQDGGFALPHGIPGMARRPASTRSGSSRSGGRDPRKSKLGFPAKYVDEDSSGLVVTVRAEANKLDPFTLK